MFGLGMPEMIIVGVMAVLLFGSRLPTVARSMGHSLTEFKKGMQGIEDDFRGAMHAEPDEPFYHDDEANDRQQPSSPAFEPPKPVDGQSDSSSQDN